MFVFTYQITWNFTNRFWRTGKESTRQQTFRLIENSLFGTVKVLNSSENGMSGITADCPRTGYREPVRGL